MLKIYIPVLTVVLGACSYRQYVPVEVYLRHFSKDLIEGKPVYVRVVDGTGKVVAEQELSQMDEARKLEVEVSLTGCFHVQALIEEARGLFYGESPCIDAEGPAKVTVYLSPVSGVAYREDVKGDDVCFSESYAFIVQGEGIYRWSLTDFNFSEHFYTWREGAAMACSDLALFVAGGMDEEGPLREVCSIDASGERCAEMDTPLLNASGKAFQGGAVFCGGVTPDGRKVISCVFFDSFEVRNIGEVNFSLEKPVFVASPTGLFLFTGMAYFKVSSTHVIEIEQLWFSHTPGVFSGGKNVFAYASGKLWKAEEDKAVLVADGLPLLESPYAVECGEGSVIVGRGEGLILSHQGILKRHFPLSFSSPPLGGVRIGLNTALFVFSEGSALINCAEGIR